MHRAFLCCYSSYVSVMWPNAASRYNKKQGQNLPSVSYEHARTLAHTKRNDVMYCLNGCLFCLVSLLLSKVSLSLSLSLSLRDVSSSVWRHFVFVTILEARTAPIECSSVQLCITGVVPKDVTVGKLRLQLASWTELRIYSKTCLKRILY
jgi:hypothetical protein